MFFLRLRGVAVMIAMAVVIALLSGVVIYQLIEDRMHLAGYERLGNRYRLLSEEIGRSGQSSLDEVISKYILNRLFTGYKPADRKFESHFMLGAEQKQDTINLYLYIRHDGYSYRNSEFEHVCGGMYPVLLQVEKTNGFYRVAGYKKPKDGQEYENSLRELFPESMADKALYGNSGIKKKLEDDITNQVNSWLEGEKTYILDPMAAMNSMFPKLDFARKGSLFSAGERQSYFIESMLTGTFTSSDACEALVMVRRPSNELSHVEGFYQVYAAVLDCLTGKLKSEVRLFNEDEGEYQVFRGRSADYLFFAGSTTYQGWTEWDGGLWKAGEEWIKIWPVEAEFWKDKAVSITDTGLKIYNRKVKEGNTGVIPPYTWEYSHSLYWDGQNEEFVRLD